MSKTAQRSARREQAESAWVRLTAWPFLVLSAVFLVAYSIHCLDPSLLPRGHEIIAVILITIWAVFVIDYVVRLLLASDRRAFVRKNIPDLLAALLPVFRPFRLLRELRHIKVFKGTSGRAIRARLTAYSASFVALWVYTIAISEVYVERGAPGATIVSLGDALYWAVVTMATVGYGDMVPVTTAGRVLAVMLMISGVAIVGITTATIVSYLNDAVRKHVGPDDADPDGVGEDDLDADENGGDDSANVVQVAEGLDEMGAVSEAHGDGEQVDG